MNAESYSGINTFQRCPKKYQYAQIESIQLIERGLALFNGINVHELLKVYFLALQRGVGHDEALKDVYAEADIIREESRHLTFDDEFIKGNEQLDEMLQVVENYLWQLDEVWEILHVEEEFLLKMDSGKIITFTPDLIVRDTAGFVWIVDHKTTSRVPRTGLPFGDQQALLYYAGIKEMYPNTAGFIFNKLRKKIPAKPRLTKTGKKRVHDVSRIDTTYEVLKNFLEENAPDLLADGVHQRRLAELRDSPSRYFWQEVVYVTQEQMDEVLADASQTLDMIRSCQVARRWPRALREDNGYLSCSKCPYQELCQAELLGWDTTDLRERLYEPRGPKNPYEEE